MMEERCSPFKLRIAADLCAPARNYLHVWSAPGYTNNALVGARPMRVQRAGAF